jgi:hypothetical protein
VTKGDAVPEPIIPKKFGAVAVAAIAIAAGLAYAWLNASHFWDVWRTDAAVPEPNAAWAYTTSGLAGLIGGITALAFGISTTTNTAGLANVTTAGAVDRTWVGALYVTVYFLVGAAALVLWISDGHPTEVIKNVSTVTLGMVIPIVVGYFQD